MEQLIFPIISSLATATITWFFARRKNSAEAKSAEIDNEVKSAEFYQSLLDDSVGRINKLIEITEQLEDKIKERDAKIEFLIKEIEELTTELRKYKQLNGKSNGK